MPARWSMLSAPGTITPAEALDMSLSAIETSELNAFCHLDAEGARQAAVGGGRVPSVRRGADRGQGARLGRGWPYSEASLVFEDRTASHTSTMVQRLSAAGAVPVGATTASEFGGVNYTHTRIHGTTRNPWNMERTPGGSSGGTAAAVAGGLVTLGTAGDGGGSIRIPAGFTGMFGLKATYGRIPRGPRTMQPPLTVTSGCVSRSVRDTARWFDVCNGHDSRDTVCAFRMSWDGKTALGTLRGCTGRQAGGRSRSTSEVRLSARASLAGRHPAAEALISDAGLKRVDLAIQFPEASLAWVMSNIVTLMADLGELYPECEEQADPRGAVR